MIISGLFAVIGMVLSGVLRSKFAKYSQMPMTSGMSGRDVAAAMLKYYGINDVRITQIDGQLTDHYNPEDKTVNLSADVYNGQHVSAAAVAAHECGHAVQHASNYPMLGLRSAMVPAVNIAASLQQYVLMFGLAAAVYLNSMIIALVVLGVFTVTALFSLVTLPVEFDASRRALAWLDETGTAKGEQYDGAKDALTWAALTYVSAALASVVQLLYLAMQLLPIITGGNRRDQA